jgi:hypothetical protein
MSTIRMKVPACRVRDRLVVAAVAIALPSIAFAQDNVCLPAPSQTALSTASIDVDPGDPTPIIVDCAYRVQGVTLTGAPGAAATVVNDGNSLVIRTVSPPADPGTDAAAVAAPAATVSIATPVTQGVDSSGNACVLVSITDVQPSSGVLPAGSVVAVTGSGFRSDTQVELDGIAAASASWVDSSHIEIITATDARLDGSTVTVTNSDGSTASYVPYVHATSLGKSANPLLAATDTIFPLQPQATAVFSAPATGTFFGLTFQNSDAADSTVSVEVWDAGSVVASASITLPSQTSISRDLSELFPGLTPDAGSVFQVTATVPVQMVGLSGNTTDGSVVPVLPSLASP